MIAGDAAQGQVDVADAAAWVGGRTAAAGALARVDQVRVVAQAVVDLVLVVHVGVQHLVRRDEVEELAELEAAGGAHQIAADVVARIAHLHAEAVAAWAVGDAAAWVRRAREAGDGAGFVPHRHVVGAGIAGAGAGEAAAQQIAPLRLEQRRALPPFQRHGEVAAIHPVAEDEVGHVLVVIAAVVHLVLQAELGALVAAPGHDVEHAGHRVRAVQRGGAVLQDVHALDGDLRNQVVEVGVQHPLAVQQRERGATAEAAQIGAGAVALGVGHRVVRGEGVGPVVEGLVVDDLAERRRRLHLDVHRIKHLQRRRRIEVVALDERAGNDDLFDLLLVALLVLVVVRLLRQRGAGQKQQRRQPSGNRRRSDRTGTCHVSSLLVSMWAAPASKGVPKRAAL